ncbi:MAG: signal peptidase I [Candidatus Kerfeldbacteria bacterium]|nr:signal peptidase I [Candidatus Kerfeldbacteria bacterium]
MSALPNDTERKLADAVDEINRGEAAGSFWESTGLFFLEVIKIVVVAALVIVPIRFFIAQPFYVNGASMEPTFHDFDYLIINEIEYRFREPQRGDIIVFRSPEDDSEFFIKRVIGLPGEEVMIQDSQITIRNDEHPTGVMLNEDYLASGTVTSGNSSWRLKNDEFFVLGDNRSASLDGRIFGPTDRDEIIGRAWVRAWPVSKWDVFESLTYN